MNLILKYFLLASHSKIHNLLKTLFSRLQCYLEQSECQLLAFKTFHSDLSIWVFALSICSYCSGNLLQFWSQETGKKPTMMAGLGDHSLALTGTGNQCIWTSQCSEPWGKAMGLLLPCWGDSPPFSFLNWKQKRDGHGVSKFRCSFSTSVCGI